jgi:tripartite-type tricarboxylate transporter receptor subunit TctC
MRTLLLAVLAAIPLAGFAQSSPYAGKTVTIIVGYKAGGGYDATARLLARHLPKHIPGKPTSCRTCRARTT